ncbi:RagB/SusD family nutrient uptake outer membrane protein [Fibrisoma montanum]|uniref:RagB/SusD family nutrient uptake outer membrane protein n=1 Tax=Fibrisoma montanum TaxID=2305895 RepID=A0A418LX78_9BACT|nr:RagB/SusD family nutrient uptake outer membrane protein [Fibrisoma montanum]RIV17973.1 RagB/SusD family nutrient uptake outer membrane protein [Fibrisoma montanum]
MKKISTFLALTAMLSLSSCHEQFLEEEAYSFLSPGNFYANAKDAQAAVNGVYKKFYDNDGNYYGYNMLAINELPTEAVTSILWDQSVDFGRLDTWNTRVGDVSGIYQNTYQIINRANAVLDNVPRIAMDETLKKRILGEARFLRALAYFNGVRLYGDLPLLLTETRSLDNLQVEAAPASRVYQQIIEDLTFAKDNLPSVKTYGAADRGRASRSAAKTLLGKVYLTRATVTGLAQPDDYQKAVTTLREVITDGDHALEASFAKLWDYETNENNAEVIFDIQLTRTSGLGGRLTRQISTANTGNTYASSFQTMNVELDFYKSYNPGDTRLDVTFDNQFLRNGQVVKFDPANPTANGFPQDTPGFRKNVDFNRTADLDKEEPNFIVLRYADVLLMLAEALNEVNKGPNAEAYDLINRVRRRAFGKSITSPDAQVDLTGLDYQRFRQALYTERRKELVMEAHGWFDGLRFYDIFIERVSQASVGAVPTKAERPKLVIDRSRIADPKFRLFPIPTTVIERNPNIKQNPGW